MAEEELQMEEGGKGKMIIIIVVAVLIIGGGAAAYFLLGGSDEPQMEETMEASPGGETSAPVMTNTNKGTALYVAMPRPFVFNVPGQGRDRLAQIKVQLMVRGTDNEELAKMHIPLIEGTLLKVFSSANADDLVTEAGKVSLRDQSAREVQKVLSETVGNEIVEQVLFTGFVMQ